MKAPRIYALDIVVPSIGTEWQEPVVIDLNGSRSGLTAAQAKTGDARVEIEVLRRLADAGHGRILSPVQRQVPLLRERFSLEAMLAEFPEDIGISRASDAYMPVGLPNDISGEDRVAELARSQGIDYQTVFADWDEETRDFRLSSAAAANGYLGEWDPGNCVIWPYSWDRRAFALPAPDRVVAPLPLHLLTTNKQFLAAVDAQLRASGPGLAMPPTLALGFHREGGSAAERIMARLAGTDKVIVKPAAGFRGFGVVILPLAALQELSWMSGIVADEAGLEMGRRVLAAASLAGELPDACTVVQPYVNPAVRRHRCMGALHRAIHRAIVVADDSGLECLDVTCILAKEPRDPPEAWRQRGSLILFAHDDPTCVDPRSSDGDAVRAVAEGFIAAIETYADSVPVEAVAALRHESMMTAAFGDRTYEIEVSPTVAAAWDSGRPLIEVFAKAMAN